MIFVKFATVCCFATLACCKTVNIANSNDATDTFQNQRFPELLSKELTERGTHNGGRCQLADIILLLDSSGSVTQKHFKTMKRFVIDMANTFEIGPRAVQMGVISFSDFATVNFYLNSNRNKAQLTAAIERINFIGSGTRTHEGLSLVMTDGFTSAAGDRADAKNILIVITDGKSNMPEKIRKQAIAIHKKNIKALAVGVGQNTDETELKYIASESNLVFHAKDFDALKYIEGDIMSMACAQEGTLCGYNPADIVFLLDSSGSIRNLNFDLVKRFVCDFIDPFEIGPYAVQVGVVSFSDWAKRNLDLNSFKDKETLTTAIERIKFMASSTQTDQGLRLVRTKSFTSAAGARAGAKNILIVITDGKSNDSELTRREAAALHKMGNIKVLAVGVGNADQMELNAIASKSDHVFTVENFDALSFIEDDLRKKACA